MGKAEQRCRQAPSVAILRHDKLSRIICRGEQRSPVLRICCKFRIVGENFFCCRTLLLPWAYYFDERTPFARAQDLL